MKVNASLINQCFFEPLLVLNKINATNFIEIKTKSIQFFLSFSTNTCIKMISKMKSTSLAIE
jgi:hypothetical protein